MSRTRLETQEWLDQLDPATTPAEDISDLADIARAVDARDAAEDLIAEPVQRARARGRSWARIAVALGVSRQSAHERYGARRNPERRSGE
jgi:hypothetical protein